MVGEVQRAASKFIAFENVERMSTQPLRQGLDEKLYAWIENLQPLAPNKLLVVPGQHGVFNYPQTTKKMFYAAINGKDLLIVFTTAGSAYAMDINAGTYVKFAADGTFSNPDMTTWLQERILINDPTSGYCTWDGTTLIGEGNVSPVFNIINPGAGIAVPPVITISGGSGSGATAVASVSGGEVVAVTLTNPGIGYGPNDTLTVTVGTGSGGTGATATAIMTGYDIGSVNFTGELFGDLSFHPFPVGHQIALVVTGGVGGSGFACSAVCGIDPVSGLNFVASVLITAPGANYLTLPTVGWPPSTILPQTTAPLFTPVFGTQQVASINPGAGGGGYTSAPDLVFDGGGLVTGGVAATGHTTISGGAVTGWVLDTPGSGYTGTPTIIIGTGGGAVVKAHPWPFVAKGTTLAVFRGRVWLGSGTDLAWTGTLGYEDFGEEQDSTGPVASGSGSTEIKDADLIHAIVALRSFNNYLYIFGDQSIKQIGDITVGGSAGDQTLFTIITISSDQGTVYQPSIISFNRVVMFANNNGIFAVLGSSVSKISDDLDGIWKLLDLAQGIDAALLDISRIHNAVWLVRYRDPVAGERSLMLAFNGKKWFPLSQGNSLLALVNSAQASNGVVLLWGSSGSDVTQLFFDDTVPVSFKMQTALTAHGNVFQGKKPIRGGVAIENDSGADQVFQVSIETENGLNTYFIHFPTGYSYNGQTVEAASTGKFLGMTLTGTAARITFSQAGLEYQETWLWNK